MLHFPGSRPDVMVSIKPYLRRVLAGGVQGTRGRSWKSRSLPLILLAQQVGARYSPSLSQFSFLLQRIRSNYGYWETTQFLLPASGFVSSSSDDDWDMLGTRGLPCKKSPEAGSVPSLAFLCATCECPQEQRERGGSHFTKGALNPWACTNVTWQHEGIITTSFLFSKNLGIKINIYIPIPSNESHPIASAYSRLCSSFWEGKMGALNHVD